MLEKVIIGYLVHRLIEDSTRWREDVEYYSLDTTEYATAF